MELRQTIRTGIRNIRRAWWEPGLMLALSALLVAAAWLWIPAPLVENPVQTELLYIQVDSGTHGMVRWKPKTMVERQTARAIVDHMATLHKKNTLCPAHKALEECNIRWNRCNNVIWRNCCRKISSRSSKNNGYNS